MTTNAEEETNPPEMLEIVKLDGSVGRALEYNPKVVGSNPTPVEVVGLRLLAHAWRNAYLWKRLCFGSEFRRFLLPVTFDRALLNIELGLFHNLL